MESPVRFNLRGPGPALSLFRSYLAEVDGWSRNERVEKNPYAHAADHGGGGAETPGGGGWEMILQVQSIELNFADKPEPIGDIGLLRGGWTCRGTLTDVKFGPGFFSLIVLANVHRLTHNILPKAVAER